ncbi:MAG: glycosyltransferase family 4 protein [Planctomycetes bacterium]|nr:glycosyltransferase family 4 protein [Planctomycetota bacterium]
MTSVLHVIDRNCDVTQLQVLETLRLRHTQAGIACAVAAIDSAARRRARVFVDAPIEMCPRLLPSPFMNMSPGLSRLARKSRATIVHAWGVEAAAVCSTVLRGLPLSMNLLNPESTDDAARWVRTFPAGATVVAGSQLIQSRLLTAGLPAHRIVVVRGAADFAAVNKARRDGVREYVVGSAKPVVLLSGPASEIGGQKWAIWASGIVRFLHPGLKVILPYDAPESRKLLRWVSSMRMRDMVVVPDVRLTWPELVACADVFLQPTQGEVCTEPLATAMAANVPVVASAVRSIAEMIADKHNGLLVKNAEPKLVAARLLTAIEDAVLVRQITETARSQAYEVFGVRAFADNYLRVYENIAAGRSAGDGVMDTAMVA